VTLRLTSGMYHRFHAPYACTVKKVRYLSGDTWNVNPVALKRVEKLFCKNERAFLDTHLRGGPADGQRVALVPVAGHFGGQHPAAFPGCAAAPGATTDPRPSPATRLWTKGKKWAGSSMVPP